MYYSIGNIMSAPQIGLLFIDFETPNRLRVQGAAEVLFDHPLLEIYPGAQFLIAVAVEFDLGQLSALHPSAPQTRAVEIRARSWPGTAFACMETDRHRAGGTGEGRPRTSSGGRRRDHSGCLRRIAGQGRGVKETGTRIVAGITKDRGDPTFVDGGAMPAVMGK